jgi:hypothetical protein
LVAASTDVEPATAETVDACATTGDPGVGVSVRAESAGDALNPSNAERGSCIAINFSTSVCQKENVNQLTIT